MSPVSDFLSSIRADIEANPSQTKVKEQKYSKNKHIDGLSTEAPSSKRQKVKNSNDQSKMKKDQIKSNHNKNAVQKFSKNNKERVGPPADLPKDIVKYWYSRYRLFSLFDQGIRLNHAMWFSVTPEDVARVIANQAALRYPRAHAILDPFGGAGGNTIQFAMEFKKVIYFDIERENLNMARHNCRVYDMLIENEENKQYEEEEEQESDDSEEALKKEHIEEYNKNNNIEFYKTDFFKFKYPPIDKEEQKKEEPRFTREDVVFLSPPWGGVAYSEDSAWSLAKCQPYSIQSIVKHARKTYSNNIILYLPRNLDLDELMKDKDIFPELNGTDQGKSKAEKKITPAFYLNQNGRCKAMLIFLGPGLEFLKYDIYK